MRQQLFITCEHSSNVIPAEYQHLFNDSQELLKSHRGWDIGAHMIYKALCEHFRCMSLAATSSRLLVELNRSTHHRQLLSELSQKLDVGQKKQLLERFYWPYRTFLTQSMMSAAKQDFQIIHLSIHSFTPVLNNKIRNADVGLLYDPQRSLERAFALRLKENLDKNLKVRLNYPYRGYYDGLTTTLRGLFPSKTYIGLELESNQKYFNSDGRCKTDLVQQLLNGIKEVL